MEASTTTTASVTGATTAATVAGSTGTTATTARRTTATTRKSVITNITVNKGVAAAPAGGIGNVTTTSSTAPRTDVQPGGTLTWLKAGDVTSLDPITMVNNGSTDGPPAFAIFDMLLYTDGGIVTPQLATSLTSTDALVWTLTLHPGVKFTDGTNYDAAAVKYNIERLQEPKNTATRAAQANLIASMDATDAVTLKMTLKAKNAVFPQALALIPFVGSPTAIKADANKFASAPIGAGPFILKSWQRDSQMILERNPNYWNAPLPYLDQMVIKPIQDETQRVNTFCAGGGNLVHMTSVGNADRTQRDKCGTINALVLNGGINLLFNMTKPPMDNAKLRQAIVLGLDMTDLSQVTTGGVIPALKSIFRDSSPFFDAGILQQTFNKTQAQALIDQVYAANGNNDITIPIASFGSGAYGLAGQYVASRLGQYNHLKVPLQVETTGQHIATCTSRSYTGICLFGNIFEDPEPTWTGLYTCASASNYTGYCNSKFDADIADNQLTLDPKQRIADIKDAQKQFYADVPAVFLQNAYSWMFTAPNVQDFHYSNDGLPLIDRIWIKTH